MSVEQSRQKWLIDGIFKKYWTKPLKKSNQLDLQNNPAKDSMVKLGPCSMIIEPHVFDIMLYTVKKDVQQQPSAVFHVNAQADSLSSSSAVVPLPTSNLPTEAPLQIPAKYDKPNTQPTLPPFREGFAHFEPPGLPSVVSSRFAVSPQDAAPSTTTHSTPLPSKLRESVANTDPVIQMLATRAATDSSLKALMKVVAHGNATTDQLTAFQKHIDELNSIIQAQKDHHDGISTPSANAATGKHQSLSSTYQIPSTTAAAHAPYILPPAPIKIEPLSQYYSNHPQYSRSKGPVPLRAEISSVVFDFIAGTGDRYEIPGDSILEYLPGNTQVLVSFLLIREGHKSSSGGYKPNVEYYEPVTIRLSTHVTRTLDPLKKVVGHPEEVRKKMTNIMTKMTLADDVYLATQLPRSHEEATIGNNEPQLQCHQEVLKPFYSPPNSLLPLYSAKNL